MPCTDIRMAACREMGMLDGNEMPASEQETGGSEFLHSYHG